MVCGERNSSEMSDGMVCSVCAATGFLADKVHFFPFVVGVVLGCAMPSVPNFAALASRLLSLCWGATSRGIKGAPEPAAAPHGAEKSSAEVALPEFGD